MISEYVPYVPNMFLNKPTEPDYEPASVVNIKLLDECIHIHRIKNHLPIGPKHNAMFANNWNKTDTVLTFRNKMEHLGLNMPYLGANRFKLPDGSLNDELNDEDNVETIIHSIPWKDDRLYYVILDYT